MVAVDSIGTLLVLAHPMEQPRLLKQFWYPILQSAALASGDVLEARIFGQPLAIFRDNAGQVHALEDACSHRSAKLSAGQVVDDRLRCPYHGWQYDSAGQCRVIPSLDPNATLPAGAKVRAFPARDFAGLIWVWPGQPEEAAEQPEMGVAEEAYFTSDKWDLTCYQRDLDFRSSLLVENLLDPAHIHFVHAGTMSRPENAGPIDPPLILSEAGFRSPHIDKPGVHSAYTGPALVTLYFNFGVQRSVQFFYCVPTSATQCRLINQIYSVAGTRRPESIIAAVDHVLGEDIGVLEQVEQRLREGYPQCRVAVPADRALVEYQKWCQRHAD